MSMVQMAQDATPRAWLRGGGDERELIDSLLDGDRRAAEDLVARTYARTFAALFRMCGDRDLAADLTQETYRKAWASLAGFRRNASFSTWLFRIAYNTFLNHVRRPQLMRPLEDEHSRQVREPGKDHEERLGDREISLQLRRAVLALPEELRATVTAHFWGELPVRDIARADGVTGAAIRKRLKKAIASIRIHLEREAAS